MLVALLDTHLEDLHKELVLLTCNLQLAELLPGPSSVLLAIVQHCCDSSVAGLHCEQPDMSREGAFLCQSHASIFTSLRGALCS